MIQGLLVAQLLLLVIVAVCAWTLRWAAVRHVFPETTSSDPAAADTG